MNKNNGDSEIKQAEPLQVLKLEKNQELKPIECLFPKIWEKLKVKMK